MVLGVMSTGFYLYMNSLKPAKGYTLKQLQMENSELESDQRALEHQIIEAQSVITIEGSDTLEEMDTAANEDLSYTKDSNFAQTQ